MIGKPTGSGFISRVDDGIHDVFQLPVALAHYNVDGKKKQDRE